MTDSGGTRGRAQGLRRALRTGLLLGLWVCVGLAWSTEGDEVRFELVDERARYEGFEVVCDQAAYPASGVAQDAASGVWTATYGPVRVRLVGIDTEGRRTSVSEQTNTLAASSACRFGGADGVVALDDVGRVLTALATGRECAGEVGP